MRGRPVSRILSRVRRPRDDHSSGPIVTNRPLAANPGFSGSSVPVVAHTKPLFGIAPGGACRAVCVATSAVGSYPTVSPLPPYRRRSVLCGAIPRVTPAGHYPAPCFSWSPDFPRRVTPPRSSNHPRKVALSAQRALVNGESVREVGNQREIGGVQRTMHGWAKPQPKTLQQHVRVIRGGIPKAVHQADKLL